VTLECAAYGEPMPKVNWRKTDGALKNGRTKVRPEGLLILDIEASDEGIYLCEADNGVAPSLIHRIHLQVQGK